MKKFLSILLAAFCALLPTLAQAQDSTTMTTTVPSEHTITIVCEQHGAAVVREETYSGAFFVKVKRLDSLTIVAKPDDGYGLSQVKVDNMDGVTVKGRKITLSGVYCENTITLTFYKLPAQTETPPTTAPEPTAAPASGEPTLADTVTLPEISTTENVLYDAYLGTGSGLGQLSIVFDGEYLPQDYELLNVKSDDVEQKNSVLVRAYPEEDGSVARRSLILSAAQLVKLAQKQQTERLCFENGDAVATVDMVDLLSGDVQKLIGLILKGDEAISAETLNRDWSEVSTIALTAAELESVKAEVRIIPVKQADGGGAYDVSVWLRWDDRELEVSDMLPSLQVCLNVDDKNARQYVVGYCAESAAGFLTLESALALIPEELPEHQPDEAERFVVTLPEDGGAPVTAYDADARLAPYRRYVLTVDYVGKGCYQARSAE